MSSGNILFGTIVLLGIVAGVGIYIFHRITATREDDAGPRTVVEAPAIKDIYFGLRERALQMTPADMEVGADADKAYGVIMDWNIGPGVVTLVAWRTGDTSMYFSSGGGIIGGGQHDQIKRAAVQFVEDAEEVSDKRTFDAELPRAEQVKFHFLRPSGKNTVTTNIDELEAGTTSFTQYFDKANYLINELRKTTEDTQ